MTIRFKSVRIRKYAKHLDNTFVFEKGLNYVRGCNLDAPWSSKGNSNGAGKSTLFKPLIPLIFGTSRKGKTGSYEIEFLKDKNLYRVHLDKMENSISILANNRYENFRTKADARNRVSELFPWNYDQFTSLVYLNSLATNTILSGTPNQRHKLFESIFDLELVDNLAEQIKNRLNQLKTKQDLVIALKDQLPEKENISLPKAKKWLVQAEKQQKILENELEDANSAIAILRAWEAFDPKYAQIDLTQKMVQIRAKIKELSQARDLYSIWQNQLQEYNEYSAKKKIKQKIQNELAQLPQEVKNNILQSVSVLITKLNNAKATRKKVAQAKLALEEIAKMPKMRGIKLTNSGIMSFYREGNAAAKALSQLAHATHHCPCCGAKLTEEHRIAHLRQLTETKKRWELIKDTLQEATKALRIIEINKEFLLNDSEIANLQRLIEKAQKREADSIKRIELEAELRQIKLVRVEPPKNKPPKINSQELRQLEEEFAKIQALAKIKETLIIPTEKTKSLAAKQPELISRLAKLNSLIQKRSEIIYRVEYDTQQENKLQIEISKAEKALADYLPLQALRQVLGPKGVRVTAITSLLRLYETNLNKFGREIFGDKYSFICRVNNRNLEIIYTVGSDSEDIAELSGYESRAYIILHLLSLLPLIPSELRSNVLIFDEIEANLSPENVNRFAEQILPKLQKIVPTIVILTAKAVSEFSTPGCLEWLVERKQNISILKKVGG